MAELAASLVVAPLLSLVKDKVCNSLLDQYKVMEGMEKNHEILKLKLPAILDVIADAEKQASRRGGVKAWVEELKKAAYVGIDVFDEFEYEALRRRAKKDGHITKLGMAGVKLFPTHNRLAFRIRMGKKLSTLVDSIKVLVEQMKDFGLDRLQPEAAPAWKEWRETASSMDEDPNNIVSRSRDKEREKIIEVLLNQQASSRGDLLVIPIVGMGGLGKTTLAQLIYNDPRVQDHFQQLKWVCVSDDFNVRDLANKICNSSEKTLEEALKKLQEHLRGKRYLLVLDDVWNKDVDKWGKLKACLKQDGVGSAILTTTRDIQIAGFMGTVTINNSWEKRYHDMEILDKEFIKEIIETRAFSLQKTKPKELVELVGPIADRCVGSPLAAKALGSVLCNKTTTEEWEDILHRSRICDDETQILHILKLSYNDLPTDMKQGFAFCAMYPKDYPIDVDELIQLWMANGYISDQNRVPAETMGKRIVSEMVSRSFFQYEEQRRIGHSSKTFVKIHDLMHDVALSASEKECVCITDEFIQSGELLPSAVRHILLQTSTAKKELKFLFGTTREMFPSIQTLIFDRSNYYHEDVLHESKFSSLRALSPPIPTADLSIKLKHLCHLRYLDLSDTYHIEALPDDISILYSLQTLKLSGSRRLKRLPEQMKFMTALRHLYTDGCEQLECMPPDLGQITSLRTITWFVVGSGLNCCSGLGELKDLNIGGSLMLKKLENVTRGGNAKAANLENKRELKQLSLEWTSGKEEEQQCHEVLESLKVHDGLLALEIYSYQGTSFPSWMGMLKNMVELRLSNCRKAKHLPPLCQLAGLQLLHLKGLGKLQFLCSSCTSSTFGKLKHLKLVNLDVFDGFCEITHGGVVAFPRLEILHIKGCKTLAALPEALVLREPYGGGDYTVAHSAFPELKKLKLKDLYSFERWETAVLETEEDDALFLFPSLETAFIEKCPKLTTLPRAPKLKELDWSFGNGQISIGGFGYMTSLSSLHLDGVKLDDKEEWDHPSSVVDMRLARCSLFFQPRAALALWVCYGQLQDLAIKSCDDLVYWPEKVFQSLISLRGLWIHDCKNLIGYAPENSPDQATSSSGRSQLLPHLESLEIHYCESLVEVFNSPTLKTMKVKCCRKVESLCGKQRLNQEASSTNDVTASTAAEEEKLSASVAPHNLLPSSLESLTIWKCDGLSEAVDLPLSLRKIDIQYCSKLRFVSSSGQLDALQYLTIRRCPELRSLESLRITDLSALEKLSLEGCISLASLPSAPEAQEYASLRLLKIKKCPGIKSLPSALQQRVDSGLVGTDLDSRLQGGFPRLLGRLCSSLSNS